MLEKLSVLDSISFSRHLDCYILPLLKTGNRGLLKYLETCYFQSVDMKKIRKLNINLSGEMLTIGNHSSIIDSEFRYKIGDINAKRKNKNKKMKEKDKNKEEHKEEQKDLDKDKKEKSNPFFTKEE
jgi:hypothetical protein